MSKKAKKDRKRLAPPRRYLEHIKATRFGRFSNLVVGPFTSGMNVVYGPNEAGKTTLNELIKGVMFGWPSARGSANPYRPDDGARSGSLFFRDADGVDIELTRTRNADGVDDQAGILADIDRDTYQTMFALTSDELLGLDRHDEVTARLLTAGSGTASSPAHALEAVNARIRALMSRSSGEPDSIANLRDEQARLRAEVQRGLEEAQSLRDQERTLASLEARRETLAATSDELNERIERLKTLRARIGELEADANAARESLATAQEAYQAARDDEARMPDGDLDAVAALSREDDARLRDALDDLEAKQLKFEHAIDGARKDANRSRADYEVLMEDARLKDREARARSQRRLQAVLAVAIPLAMVAIGLFVLYRMREAIGLSYLIAVGALVLFALLVAGVGLAMSVRPNRVEEEWESERKKKAWVMQQDAKTLEACERDAAAHAADIEEFLAACGLSAAHGSLRRARRLLDEARDFRAEHEAASQNSRALALQCNALQQALDRSVRQRAEAFEEAGLGPDATADELDRLIDQAVAEREQTARAAHETERSIGEITQRLSAARHVTEFDQVKTEAASVDTRLAEGYRRLAALLVARSSLEAAIADWERKSQPEVYSRASRLFERMTGGTWRQIRTAADGSIEVVDAVKTTRDPRLLSLGTRQQLYLSLRIALLMAADNVGRDVPVLCDDILVNFDDARRIEAARALIDLSRRRQVILFTCHPDVASLVRRLDPTSNLIEL